MNISVFSLAVTIAGAFIGAGFVSGQELWQFFGAFGAIGVPGFFIAIALITILSAITVSYASSKGKNTFEDVICSSDSGLLKKFISVFQYVFYIGLYIIMTSGVESLVCHYFDVSKIAVGVMFCSLVSAVSLLGIKGILSSFSLTIPLLVTSTVIIAFLTLTSVPISFRLTNNNSLISNWFISALVFVSYNFFAGIGVFAAMSKHVKTTKRLLRSSVLGCLFLLLIGTSVILTVSATKTEVFDMPMLEAARLLHPWFSVAYAVLLIFAMFGGAISSLFPIVESIKSKRAFNKKTIIIITVLVSCISVILSLFGFSNLISTVYPVFGYFGFAVIVIVIYNFAKHKFGGR